MDYLSSSKRIERDVRFKKWMLILLGLALSFLPFLLFLGIAIQLPSLINPSNARTILPWICLTMIGFFFLSLIITSVIVSGSMQKRAIEIDRSKPDFLRFFTTWNKEKNKQKLVNTLTIAGEIALAGLVGAASAALGSSEDYRVRRAVDHELTRRGL